MKKNKEVDKDLENNEEEFRKENYFEVFLRNYRNVPGFRSLVKLGLYFIFIAIFIAIATSGASNNRREDSKPTNSQGTTAAVSKKNIVYKEVLDNVIKEKKDIYVEININNKRYIIDAINENNEIIGYFESVDNTRHFKISNMQIYEIKLNEEVLNEHLFDDINLDFIIPANLIGILKAHVSTKMITDYDVVYSYNININNKDYVIKTHVKENNLTNITLETKDETYHIIYE